jgi:hypothetical protein
MDAIVLDVFAVQSALISKVLAELFIDVRAARPPAFLTIYRISKTCM